MKASDSRLPLLQLLRDRAVHEAGAVQAFQAYLSLLEKWNESINITASTAWTALGPLFDEAIWAASLYPEGECRHLDIGSGGGFPAVPMRILRPRMRLQLVESRFKKCVFLGTVVRELALQGAEVANRRLDEFLEQQSSQSAWDTVSWKAVKMKPQEINLLMERSNASIEFWIFHSRELPLRDPRAWEKSTTLISRESCPARPGWFLSIYRKNRHSS